MQKLSRYFKKYKWQTAGAILCTILLVVAAFSLIGSMLELFGEEQLAPGQLGMPVLIVIVAAFLTAFQNYLMEGLASRIAHTMRTDLFVKIQGLDMLTLEHLGSENLLDCMTIGVEQVRRGLPLLLTTVVGAIISALGGITLIGRQSTALLVPYVIAVPVAAICSGIWVKMTAKRLKRQAKTSDFQGNTPPAYGADVQATRGNMLFFCAAILIMAGAICWTYIAADVLLKSEELSAWQLAAALQYGVLTLLPYALMSSRVQLLGGFQLWNKKLQGVFAQKNQVPDQENFLTPKATGIVELKRVGFQYPQAKQAALDDISFSIQPGEVTAIVGKEGCGKTTLLYLLLRMLDAVQGEVLVNGVNVKQQSKKALRNKMSVVWQQPILFTGTVEQAVADGNQDATQEQIAKALAQAQWEPDRMIQKIGRKTYQEMVGAGENLTWQQRQKLSIARAIIRQAQIYLFDESFENLEEEIAQKIWSTVQQSHSGDMVVIATRWVKWAKSAHKIVVLAEGKVAGIGTHPQLLMECEAYRELADDQSAEKSHEREGKA